MCSTLSCYAAMLFIAYPVGMPVVVFALGYLCGMFVLYGVWRFLEHRRGRLSHG